MKLLLTILSTILICSQFTNSLRILAVFPLNGRSHWIMAESVLTSLAKRGHKVDAITHFPLKDPPPNYRDISLEGSTQTMVNYMKASNISKINAQDFKFLTDITGHKICQLMEFPTLKEVIDNPPKDPPYDLVIVEVFMMPCYLAFGRHLNVPMVAMMTANFQEWFSDIIGTPHNPAYMPSLFSSYDQRMTFWERLMNTFQTNMVSLQLNYYLSEQEVYLKKYFGLNATIAELYGDISIMLINSHHSLNGISPKIPSLIDIGGVHVKNDSTPLPSDLQKWLDESTHGCIFFTFGSMVRIETFPDPLLRTFYKVFEKLAPVRVLMKVAKKEDLLPGLPKNVMIKSWFPQVPILKHKNTKAFLTHGGLLGAQEAIYFGIPLIGIPLFGDQHNNLQIVAKKHIGVTLGSVENVNEETLSNAINTILYNDTYRTNMKKLSQLFKDRPMSPVDTAIFWVEYVGRHGNILQSPVLHLNWWQRNLLDVYGFILACVALILYVAFVLIRKLKNCLLGHTHCHKKGGKSSNSKKNK
ncbi:UDP-glucosyltransferase 2-like [Osmia bicornis bicornis]|uniref:UDP-glucosyltransferase 2-like n=1 Tax=Osmia bicornis bicornis TaxID=1437191 RepID=UPI001EAEEAB3|nr:UDP-glucosyltransferase 2-like [Osmia bicornis bicornis]XP_029035424.2 UDP-glucosyltransferase 2-like [Osmia bicornis bicornis]